MAPGYFSEERQIPHKVMPNEYTSAGYEYGAPDNTSGA